MTPHIFIAGVRFKWVPPFGAILDPDRPGHWSYTLRHPHTIQVFERPDGEISLRNELLGEVFLTNYRYWWRVEQVVKKWILKEVRKRDAEKRRHGLVA